MFAYFGTTLLASLAVTRMGNLYPTIVLGGKEKRVKKRTSVIKEFREVIPIIKESTLVKILIILTLMPNVVIPIMNYQFNFAVDQNFATESGMLKFFGYFRGFLNIFNFLILLFVGRIYGRWGLPTALIFHPFNYAVAFVGFIFRFNIFTAMYARISTTIFRTTLNNPARAVLMGLLPLSHRAMVRPFLRGTVVRIGVLAGSGLIMVSEGWLHPRYLSVGAIVFVGLWVIGTFWLKRTYSGILLDLVSRNMLDLKSLEEKDVSQIFLEKRVRSQLVEAFLKSRGRTCLWYADLIESLGIEGLDENILTVIGKQDAPTQTALLQRLSSNLDERALPVLKEMVHSGQPMVTAAALKASAYLPPELSYALFKESYDGSEDPQVKSLSIAGLFRKDPERYRPTIDHWLESPKLIERRAGILAAGKTGDARYIEALAHTLKMEEDSTAIALILEGLQELKASDMHGLVEPYLKHPSPEVRRAALEALEISDEPSMRAVILLLGDPAEEVKSLAGIKLYEAPYQNPEVLIGSLAIPNRAIREGIFSLLESLDIKDVEVLRFARVQMEKAYRNLSESEELLSLPVSAERDLLKDHLLQKKEGRIENILRVLATQDRTGHMRIIWRGLYSTDSRRRSNALEALEDSIGRSLSEAIVPIIENQSISQCLAFGKKLFKIEPIGSNPGDLYAHFLSQRDWVTVVLCLSMIGKTGLDGLDRKAVDSLDHSDNAFVRDMAQRVSARIGPSIKTKERTMDTGISVPDKILHLRGIQIFEGLSVSELAAIASVTEEVVQPEKVDVIKEGEQGETMYMVISGEVSVIKGQPTGDEIELDLISGGDYFGEMALFENEVRSATIRTKEETRLLVLHKREFTEIVREYPQIALHICKELSNRLRRLHEKVRKAEQRQSTEGSS
jgi:HEAT repeat protein